MQKQIIHLTLVIFIFALMGTSFAEDNTTHNESQKTHEILIVSSSPNEIALIKQNSRRSRHQRQNKSKGREWQN